ncbi:hypothetical protein [Acidithiobacillus ferrivorans]|uniref:Uncharacterized protein n=1 Tax=Acidithiobacillus ferrivorans TaxID=160808 RepID=A0A7T4WFG9_9PROT|nr:hypothetical protein [Acidithiobacillus ferrivorans]QQD73634.1 hypothetical protein H2515_05110 [Acidithiobacillus ferrivorans]
MLAEMLALSVAPMSTAWAVTIHSYCYHHGEILAHWVRTAHLLEAARADLAVKMETIPLSQWEVLATG